MNVLIATRERPELLRRTLESLAEAERPEGELRIWVVENGGAGASETVCESSSLPVEYLRLDPPGKSRALNLGVEQIGNGFVLFLDDDVRVTPGLLRAYEGAVAGHGMAAVYGGPVEAEFDGPPPASWLLPFLPPSVTGFTPDEGKTFLGGNFGAFAENVLEVGGFDPALGGGATGGETDEGPVAEETELQERFRERGFGFVPVHEAKVWHFVASARCTPKWVRARWFRHGLTEGILWSRKRRGPKLFGTPRWVWRAVVESPLRWVLGMARSGRHGGFQHLLGFYHALGVMRGAWQQGSPGEEA
jgi:GT2 family glycosyltransferase